MKTPTQYAKEVVVTASDTGRLGFALAGDVNSYLAVDARGASEGLQRLTAEEFIERLVRQVLADCAEAVRTGGKDDVIRPKIVAEILAMAGPKPERKA